MNKLKIILFFAGVIILSPQLVAQTNTTQIKYLTHLYVGSRDPQYHKEFDKCNYRVTYQYSYVVDTVLNVTCNDLMLLEIGNSYSHYRSRYSEICDSMMYVAPATTAKKTSVHADGRNPYEWMSGDQEANYIDIFWDYPQKGIITVDEYIMMVYSYEEPIPKFEWQLLPRNKEIMGYDCMGAIATFRGREWTVWFTPLIPASLGPWKLNGLPGLILKAEDKDGYFKWEAVGLEVLQGKSMFKYDANPVLQYQKATREQVNRLLRMRWEDPVSLMGNIHIYNQNTNKYEEFKPGSMIMNYIPTLELE